MRTASAILADQLAASLSETCCDNCGSMSKKAKKKVCCGEKKEESKVVGQPRYVTIDELKKAAKTGESIDKIMAATKTEENHFIYVFPDEKKAKDFAEEAKKYGWKFETDGPAAAMIGRAFADTIAAKYGGKDAFIEGINAKKNEALEITPFLKRCVAAIQDPAPWERTKTESTEPSKQAAYEKALAVARKARKK